MNRNLCVQRNTQMEGYLILRGKGLVKVKEEILQQLLVE